MVLRERKTCPHCGGLGISRRVRTRLYVCAKCGWTGSDPVVREVVCYDPRNSSNDRIERLRQLHEANPDWKKRDLVTYGVETDYMVGLYMKSRVSV